MREADCDGLLSPGMSLLEKVARGVSGMLLTHGLCVFRGLDLKGQWDSLGVEDSGFIAWELVSCPVQSVWEGCGLGFPVFE